MGNAESVAGDSFDISKNMFGDNDICTMADFVLHWLTYETGADLDRGAFLEANKELGLEDLTRAVSSKGVPVVNGGKLDLNVTKIDGPYSLDAVTAVLSEKKIPLFSMGSDRAGILTGKTKTWKYVQYPEMLIKTLDKRVHRIGAVYVLDKGRAFEFLHDSSDED